MTLQRTPFWPDPKVTINVNVQTNALLHTSGRALGLMLNRFDPILSSTRGRSAPAQAQNTREPEGARVHAGQNTYTLERKGINAERHRILCAFSVSWQLYVFPSYVMSVSHFRLFPFATRHFLASQILIFGVGDMHHASRVCMEHCE